MGQLWWDSTLLSGRDTCLKVVGKLFDVERGGGDDDLELGADAYGLLQQTCG